MREAALFYIAVIFALYIWALDLRCVRVAWEIFAYAIATTLEHIQFALSWPFRKLKPPQ